MNLNPALHALFFCLLLGSFSFFNQSCSKPEPVEAPFNLRSHVMKRLWYADLVTQGGIDVTAAHNFSLEFKDSVQCIMQRKWQGATTLFVCTYTIDEENDAFQVKHLGNPNNTWDIDWKLMEADTALMRFRFKDTKASSDTYINLRTW